jgi:hypothetical protein
MEPPWRIYALRGIKLVKQPTQFPSVFSVCPYRLSKNLVVSFKYVYVCNANNAYVQGVTESRGAT